MTEVIQLAINSVGAIAGVTIAFYFLMPFVNRVFTELTQTQIELKNSVSQMSLNMRQHDERAEERSKAIIQELHQLKGEHEEGNEVLRRFYEFQAGKRNGGVTE